MRVFTGSLWRAGLLISAFTLFAPLAAGATNAVPKGSAETALARYGDVLRSFNPGLSLVQSQDMAAHVLMMSSYYSLDPRLLVAIVGVESGWESRAVSHSGAQGLGQLMPSTASGLGVITSDAYENLDGTARYLRRMLQHFSNADVEHRYAWAIAGYNAGPQAVARFGGIPPFTETRAYVAHVMALWHSLQARLPADGLPIPPPPLAQMHAPVPHRQLASRQPRTRPAPPTGSVAQFATLEAHSMDRNYTDVVVSALTVRSPAIRQPAPPPSRPDLAMDAYFTYDAFPPTPAPQQPKSVKRWLARAFGGPKP